MAHAFYPFYRVPATALACGFTRSPLDAHGGRRDGSGSALTAVKGVLSGYILDKNKAGPHKRLACHVPIRFAGYACWVRVPNLLGPTDGPATAKVSGTDNPPHLLSFFLFSFMCTSVYILKLFLHW